MLWQLLKESQRVLKNTINFSHAWWCKLAIPRSSSIQKAEARGLQLCLPHNKTLFQYKKKKKQCNDNSSQSPWEITAATEYSCFTRTNQPAPGVLNPLQHVPKVIEAQRKAEWVPSGAVVTVSLYSCPLGGQRMYLFFPHFPVSRGQTSVGLHLVSEQPLREWHGLLFQILHLETVDFLPLWCPISVSMYHLDSLSWNLGCFISLFYPLRIWSLHLSPSLESILSNDSRRNTHALWRPLLWTPDSCLVTNLISLLSDITDIWGISQGDTTHPNLNLIRLSVPVAQILPMSFFSFPFPHQQIRPIPSPGTTSPGTTFSSMDSCRSFWLGSHTLFWLPKLFSPQQREWLLVIKLPQGSLNPWTAKNTQTNFPRASKEMQSPHFSPQGGSCVLFYS